MELRAGRSCCPAARSSAGRTFTALLPASSWIAYSFEAARAPDPGACGDPACALARRLDPRFAPPSTRSRSGPSSRRELDRCFDQTCPATNLEAWMDESSMLRRAVRRVAVIAGLSERKVPGREDRGASPLLGLIYGRVRKHDPATSAALRPGDAPAASRTCPAGRRCWRVSRQILPTAGSSASAPLARAGAARHRPRQVSGAGARYLLDEAART